VTRQPCGAWPPSKASALSTRIEGSKLSDREVEQLPPNLQIKSFTTRDEQEAAGYAELMDLVLSSWQDTPFSENHIKRLHQILLRYSEKDSLHRGNYKTSSNSVAALDEHRVQIGIVLQTASPFDTPRLCGTTCADFAGIRSLPRLATTPVSRTFNAVWHRLPCHRHLPRSQPASVGFFHARNASAGVVPGVSRGCVWRLLMGHRRV
jgi:hypothetical protein